MGESQIEINRGRFLNPERENIGIYISNIILRSRRPFDFSRSQSEREIVRTPIPFLSSDSTVYLKVEIYMLNLGTTFYPDSISTKSVRDLHINGIVNLGVKGLNILSYHYFKT